MTAAEELARTIADLERRVTAMERYTPAGVWSAPSLPATVLATAPVAFQAASAVPMGAVGFPMKVWSYHNVVTVNQYGQVAIQTPFTNGIAGVWWSSGDVAAWNGGGGTYAHDDAGTAGRIRTFLRFTDDTGAWLSTGYVRVSVLVMGW